MPTYTLAELAAVSDVPARTIRFYISQGLLPSPGRDGPATRYPEAALARLRLIRQLQRQHLPLAEIRSRLSRLTDAEVAELASASGEPSSEPPDSALDYVRSVLGASASSRPSTPGKPTPSMQLPSIERARKRIKPAPDLLVPPPRFVLAEEAPASYEASSPPDPPAAQPDRSQWDRIVLEPDIELHVRRPLSRPQNKRVERLITFARQLLQEDQP